MKLEKLKTEDIVEIAVQASEMSLKYTPYRQSDLNKASFIEGFMTACDVFKVLGVDPNRLLTKYDKTELELYLLDKNVM